MFKQYKIKTVFESCLTGLEDFNSLKKHTTKFDEINFQEEHK